MKKVDLYRQYLVLNDQYNTIVGNPIDDWAKNNIGFIVKNYKKKEIEDLIDQEQLRIESAKKNVAVRKFFETDFGKKYKEERENLLKENYEKSCQLRDEVNERIDSLVKDTLGSKWNVSDVGKSGFRIHMTDTDGKTLFGHEFSVHIDHSRKNGDGRIEVNYGCMGSFDVETDVSRKELLVGLTSFVTNNDLIGSIKSVFFDFLEKDHALSRVVRDVSYELSHPDLSLMAA